MISRNQKSVFYEIWLRSPNVTAVELCGYGKIRTRPVSVGLHYTVSQKNWGTHIMPHSSRKCGPMLIILSLLHSQMNCRKRLNKICRLTSNLLPHYSVKFECSTLLFYSTLFNANVTQNRLFPVSVYRCAKFCFLCLCRLICNRTTCFKIDCLSMRACTPVTPAVMQWIRC